MSDSPTPPAGWFPDPEDPTLLRYWDGSIWTDQRFARPTTLAMAAQPDAAQPPIAVPPLLAAGVLLVVAGIGRAVSYLAPYEAFGISILFGVVEVLGWAGAFAAFWAAGYPSRRTGVRALIVALIGIYVLGGALSIGIAVNPFASVGLFGLVGLVGLAALAVGIAFSVATIRTPGLARRIGVLPLALYLGLIAFGLISGVASAAATSVGSAAAEAAIVLGAASGLAPATVGALFFAFGRNPHVSVG
jgi:hypothetical protein